MTLDNERYSTAGRVLRSDEGSLKLLSVPRAPKELPATAFIRNPHGATDWKLFVDR